MVEEGDAVTYCDTDGYFYSALVTHRHSDSIVNLVYIPKPNQPRGVAVGCDSYGVVPMHSTSVMHYSVKIVHDGVIPTYFWS